MIEPLLITACIFGNGLGCEKTAQAYYKYSGIDKNVRKIEQKYVQYSAAIAVVGLIRQRKISTPIYKNAVIGVKHYEESNRTELSFSYTF